MSRFQIRLKWIVHISYGERLQISTSVVLYVNRSYVCRCEHCLDLAVLAFIGSIHCWGEHQQQLVKACCICMAASNQWSTLPRPLIYANCSTTTIANLSHVINRPRRGVCACVWVWGIGESGWLLRVSVSEREKVSECEWVCVCALVRGI